MMKSEGDDPAAASSSSPMSPTATAGARSSTRGGADSGERQFLVGVVEGFYGRPWTTEQRKDLFSKMQASSIASHLIE